jgi:hypothetical protein
MTDDPGEQAIEAGAKAVAKALGYAWEGLNDRDISVRFPDIHFSLMGGLNLQGGKPACRRFAKAVLEAAALAAQQ